MKSFEEFNNDILSSIRKTRKSNIIIYGNKGGYILWLLKKNGYNVTYVIDRWESYEYGHINHLMSLYYLDCKNEESLIVETVPKSIGVIASFKDIGEKLECSAVVDIPILNVWEMFYGSLDYNEDLYPSVSYYEYLETKEDIDFNLTISRKHVKGYGSHGYYPTDVRVIYDIFEKLNKNRQIFDFGCGKCATILFLKNIGFEKLGGIEYTPEIYEIGKNNIRNLGYEDINYLMGNAMDLKTELDEYDTFFFFNPFSYEVFKEVFKNILQSMDRFSRKIMIVYAEPIGHRIILDSKRFEKIDTIGNAISGITYDTNIYVSV